MKHTKGPWEIKNTPGTLEIWASVNLGRDQYDVNLQPIYNVDIRPYIKVDEQGHATMMLTYESWRQFSSVNFQEMQKANAERIVDCVNGCEGIENPSVIKEAIKILETFSDKTEVQDILKELTTK